MGSKEARLSKSFFAEKLKDWVDHNVVFIILLPVGLIFAIYLLYMWLSGEVDFSQTDNLTTSLYYFAPIFIPLHRWRFV